MKRPLAMTIILPLLIAANFYGAANVAWNWPAFLERYPRLTDTALSAILVVITFTILGLLATWSWKRWGAVFVTLAYVIVMIFDLTFEITGHAFVATGAFLFYWIAVWPVRKELK